MSGALSFDPGPDPELIRSKQKARRNRTLGITSTVTSIAVSVAIHVYREVHADEEKKALTAIPANITETLDAIRNDVRSLSERITAIEQDRKLETMIAKAVQEAEAKRAKAKKKPPPKEDDE
jgi:hypothetical protein